MDKDQIKILIDQAMSEEGGITTSHFESIFTDAVNANRPFDAVLVSAVMVIQNGIRHGSDLLGSLELLKTTIDLFFSKAKATTAVEVAKKPIPGGPYCSFCGKSKNEVKKLNAGPNAFICNECVAVCVNLLNRDGGDKRTASHKRKSGNKKRNRGERKKSNRNALDG